MKVLVLTEKEVIEHRSTEHAHEKKFVLVEPDGTVDLEDGKFPTTLFDCIDIRAGSFWDFYETGEESVYADHKIGILGEEV